VRRAVQAGVFGKLINVESRLRPWGRCGGPAGGGYPAGRGEKEPVRGGAGAGEYRRGWRNEAAFGGGGLYDWGSHFVDQLWRLVWPAKPVRVYGQLRGNVWSRDCDDFARVLIDFDNGVVGLIEVNTTTSRPLPRWHVD